MILNGAWMLVRVGRLCGGPWRSWFTLSERAWAALVVLALIGWLPVLAQVIGMPLTLSVGRAAIERSAVGSVPVAPTPPAAAWAPVRTPDSDSVDRDRWIAATSIAATGVRTPGSNGVDGNSSSIWRGIAAVAGGIAAVAVAVTATALLLAASCPSPGAVSAAPTSTAPGDAGVPYGMAVKPQAATDARTAAPSAAGGRSISSTSRRSRNPRTLPMSAS